jgi:hypothetical protein
MQNYGLHVTPYKLRQLIFQVLQSLVTFWFCLNVLLHFVLSPNSSIKPGLASSRCGIIAAFQRLNEFDLNFVQYSTLPTA